MDKLPLDFAEMVLHISLMVRITTDVNCFCCFSNPHAAFWWSGHKDSRVLRMQVFLQLLTLKTTLLLFGGLLLRSSITFISNGSLHLGSGNVTSEQKRWCCWICSQLYVIAAADEVQSTQPWSTSSADSLGIFLDASWGTNLPYSDNRNLLSIISSWVAESVQSSWSINQL